MKVCGQIPDGPLARRVAQDIEVLLRGAYGRDYDARWFEVHYEAAGDRLELVYAPMWFYETDCRFIEAAMVIVLRKHGMADCAEITAGSSPYWRGMFAIRSTVKGWGKVVQLAKEANQR